MIDALNFGDVQAGEDEQIEDRLAGHVICSQCNATLKTYPDRCRVPLEEPCLGFLLIEGLRLHIRRKAA